MVEAAQPADRRQLRKPARPSAKVPERGADGAGGTANASVLPRIDCGPTGIVRCSPTGNRGEGATTVAGPMLMSPSLCIEACRTGGGAMMAVPGTLITRFDETTPGSGAGATPEACGRPSRRDVAWLTSGAGATTEFGLAGPRFVCASDRDDRIDPSGIIGGTRFDGSHDWWCDAFELDVRRFHAAAWACSGATRIEPRLADSAGFLYTRSRPAARLPRKAGNDPVGL